MTSSALRPGAHCLIILLSYKSSWYQTAVGRMRYEPNSLRWCVISHPGRYFITRTRITLIIISHSINAVRLLMPNDLCLLRLLPALLSFTYSFHSWHKSSHIDFRLWYDSLANNYQLSFAMFLRRAKSSLFANARLSALVSRAYAL